MNKQALSYQDIVNAVEALWGYEVGDYLNEHTLKEVLNYLSSKQLEQIKEYYNMPKISTRR